MITFASAPADGPDSMAFALDIYDIINRPAAVDAGQVVRMAGEGHENIEMAFESSIKDNLRVIFEEEKT